MEIYTKKINNYTTEITIDEKKLVLTDNNIKNQKKLKIESISKLVKFLGYFIACASALYIIGIVGHSDMIDELRLTENWSTYDYVLRSISGFATLILGTVLAKAGDVVDSFKYDL